MSRIETAALALVQKAPGGGNKTFAKLVIGIVVLVMGILAVALVLTQKSAFNSRPNAFVEQFNRTLADHLKADFKTIRQMKKFYCEKTGDGEKRMCLYTGTLATISLDTRENGTVWNADIRVRSPLTKEEEEKRQTYNDAFVTYCAVLIGQTSGLNSLDALDVLSKLLASDKDSRKTKGMGGLVHVGGVVYTMDLSSYIHMCGAYAEHALLDGEGVHGSMSQAMALRSAMDEAARE